MTFDTKEKVAKAILVHIRHKELGLEGLSKSTIPYEDLNASAQSALREIAEVVEEILSEPSRAFITALEECDRASFELVKEQILGKTMLGRLYKKGSLG